jgi:hypothetical protein
MTNERPDVKVSRNYDGGIILFSAALLVVVIGGGVYLVSLAVGAAPVVASIFGILLVLLMVAGIGIFVAQQRWAINRISEVTANTARDMSLALMAYKSQSRPEPVLYAPPAQNQIADVRRQFNNGLPPGVSGARVSDGATEYIASTASLVAALDLLAEGRDPTRSNFREKGIMSSTEVSGAVNLLSSLGYIDPVVQGSPADWADGVTPASVGAISDHLRQSIPALPIFQPVFAEEQVAGRAGRQQAGRGRGSRR